MNPVDTRSLSELLSNARIHIADPAGNIGRQLHFEPPEARTIVVDLPDALEHVVRIVSSILMMDDGWVLVPRYGDVAALGLVASSAGADTVAVSFAASERDVLGRYLCERSMDLRLASTDLYVLGTSATSLVRWDHHTVDEGLTIGLRRVEDSNRLLVSLNDLGAQMEVFWTPA